MPGDEAARRAGGQRTRRERRTAGDYAIEDDRDPQGRSAADVASQRRVLEPTECREDTDRIAAIRLVQGEAALYHRHLPGERDVIHASTATRYLGRVPAGKGADENRRRPGVPAPPTPRPHP